MPRATATAATTPAIGSRSGTSSTSTMPIGASRSGERAKLNAVKAWSRVSSSRRRSRAAQYPTVATPATVTARRTPRNSESTRT